MESRAFSVVTSGYEGDVLEVLARGDVELTGRQVQALARAGSQTGIQAALERLVRQGVVLRRPAGRAYLYRLNREHLAAPAIETIANLRLALIGRLSDLIETWPVRPTLAMLFGSAARGEATAESDIDILLVRPRGVTESDEIWAEQRLDLVMRTSAWTGNDVRILEYGTDELLALTQEERVLRAIQREGVLLDGEREVLARALRGRPR